MLLAFNKPYGVLSQFTPEPRSLHQTLANFDLPKGVYPIGRLDATSEGLLLLSDEANLNARLLHPTRGHKRRYWVQIERVPSREQLKTLEQGVLIHGHSTLPCHCWLLDPQPQVIARDPPIRHRKNVPDCWISIDLKEGTYHQVRRMTASIGHPTLRLIRVQIGDYGLEALLPGESRVLGDKDRRMIFS